MAAEMTAMFSSINQGSGEVVMMITRVDNIRRGRVSNFGVINCSPGM